MNGVKPGTGILLIATICAFVVMVSVFWIGFLGSDDTLYWAAAGNWLAHPPYLGTTHWALRHTVVIPMAISRAVFGEGMTALVLPSLLYAIGFLVVTALWVRRAAGPAAAAAAMAIVVTNPQFILLASVANVDVVEVFFVVTAFALMQSAMEREAAPFTSSPAALPTSSPGLSGGPGAALAVDQVPRTSWGMTLRGGGVAISAPEATSPRRTWTLLLLAGISLGFAMLSRETSAFADVAIGLLFLAGYGMHRGKYFVIGGGFAAVVGLEFIWLWRMSGTLFYRSSIALHHDASIDRWLEQGAGVPLIHPLIDPLTMLLFNHNFGLLTWIGLPLTLWAMRRGDLPASARRLTVLAGTLALTWTVIGAGLWKQLPLIPRYFLLPDLMLSVLAGIALARLWYGGGRRTAVVLGVVLIAANLFSMSVDNRNYMYGEHELVDIAGDHPGPIHTDPKTLRRAALLLEWRGIASRVTTSPAGPGDNYYLDPARDDTKPGADWTVIEREGLPPTIGQWLASHLLPAGTLSPSLFEKLGRGHPDVTLYRLP